MTHGNSVYTCVDRGGPSVSELLGSVRLSMADKMEEKRWSAWASRALDCFSTCINVSFSTEGIREVCSSAIHCNTLLFKKLCSYIRSDQSGFMHIHTQ